MGAPADLPLTDCHVHMRGTGSVPNLREIMDACGLEAMNLLALRARGDENLNQNAACLLMKALQPARIYAFGGLRHEGAGGVGDTLSYAEQARHALQAGCDGIKLIEGKPTTRKAIGRPLDSPEFDEFYAFCQAEAVPILFHVADPETFWDPELAPPIAHERGWFYGDGTFPSKEQLYGEVDGVLARFPQLRIVFAHFFFLSADLDRLARFLDAHRSVNVDITPGSEMYANFAAQRDRTREFFTRYADRIFFGTDNAGGRRAPNPERTASAAQKVRAMRRFLETSDTFEWWGMELRGIGLAEEALAQIYAGNWRRFAGPAPKPLAREAALQECDRAVALAERSELREQVMPELREIRRRLDEATA
jgi:hypothetical protein